MNEDLAKLMILAGAAVGGCFWLIALALYRKMAGAPSVERIETPVGDRPPGDAIDSLLAQGKELLAPTGPLGVPPRISRPAENKLAIDQGGIVLQVEASRSRNQTLLAAEIDDSRYTRKYLLGFGAYVLILMPLVVGGVCLGLWHFVAPHPADAVRWQSVQVVQIVHVLWPPFLIYSLWKRGRTQLVNAASNLLVFAQVGRSGDRPPL